MLLRILTLVRDTHGAFYNKLRKAEQRDGLDRKLKRYGIELPKP